LKQGCDAVSGNTKIVADVVVITLLMFDTITKDNNLIEVSHASSCFVGVNQSTIDLEVRLPHEKRKMFAEDGCCTTSSPKDGKLGFQQSNTPSFIRAVA
jgi:hypothetical protein